jgi:hypothetical protein
MLLSVMNNRLQIQVFVGQMPEAEMTEFLTFPFLFASSMGLLTLLFIQYVNGVHESCLFRV